jgi:type VI secretion system protein ImpG
VGSRFYESELAYLREMGREFALVHPQTAGLLAEKGSDPDVERLLEGVAFLTARVREKVEDAVPSIVFGITEMLLPHYLRPIPATSIIQYSPNLKSMRGVQTVERGTKVAGKPIKGTSCQFQTTQPVDLLPMELAEVALDETRANFPVIRLTMQTTEAGRSTLKRKEGFRFMLYGDSSQTGMLGLWLRRHLVKVAVSKGANTDADLGRTSVVAAGWTDDEALLPWPARMQEGYRYLQEYFTAPDKFAFFDLRNLDKVDILADRFEIALTFERPPGIEARLTAETFRLHCTPVINLFETSAEPIRLDPRMNEHLVRAAGLDPKHNEVYEVKEVLGIRQGQTQRRAYHSFFSFGHGAEKDDIAYYTTRPSESPLDDATDIYMSVLTPRDVAPERVEETLSIDLVCTNRELPTELQLGEISVAPRGSSSPAPFKNITPVTAPSRPRLGSELHWRLLSHLALNRRSLVEGDALQSLLALYNFQKHSSPVVGRVNELKVESLRKVTSKPVTRMLSGAPVRGVITEIELEESRLGTLGEAFLFGCVLDEVLSAHVPLNSFNELHVTLHPSKTVFRYTARNGQQRIL